MQVMFPLCSVAIRVAPEPAAVGPSKFVYELHVKQVQLPPYAQCLQDHAMGALGSRHDLLEAGMARYLYTFRDPTAKAHSEGCCCFSCIDKNACDASGLEAHDEVKQGGGGMRKSHPPLHVLVHTILPEVATIYTQARGSAVYWHAKCQEACQTAPLLRPWVNVTATFGNELSSMCQ